MKRRPVWRTALFGGAALLGLALLWIIATALLARHDVDAVRSELASLKSDLANGNETGAAGLETHMQREAGAAHARTTGPAWWLASKVPFVGSPVETVRGATAIVDELVSETLPSTLRAGQFLDPHLLRRAHGQINLQRLGRAVDPLGQAAQTSGALMARAQALSGSTWLGEVNTNRTELVQDVTKFHRALADLSAAARVLPGVLGERGTQRYFLAFQTDAEARGLGGLPGDYAILQAHHGELSFLRFGADNDLAGARAHVDLGADFRREFRTTYGVPYGPEKSFANSDPSPNFPYAARIWISMWQDKFHQHLNGAIATDPTALGYLLGATGGLTLSDGTVINEGNAVAFFESGVYAKFSSDNAARKQYQVVAAQAVASKVIHVQSGDLLATVTALQRSVDEGRLLLYTSNPSFESSLENEQVGGVLPETANPFLDVIVNNGVAAKLDYYLDRTVRYQRKSCAASTATVTVILHNGAPSGGLPMDVVGGYFARHPEQLWGYNVLIVSLYGTDRSSVSRVTLDGEVEPFGRKRERGHPVTMTRFEIAPGQTQTLVFSVNEPAASGPLVALRQPGVRPLNQTVSMPDCA